MDSNELAQWIVECAPITTESIGVQRRLFGRGHDEMLLVRGRDRERQKRVQVCVRRALLDQAMNEVVKRCRKQIRALMRRG